MKLVILHIYAVPCYFLLRRSKYLPRYPLLERSHPVRNVIYGTELRSHAKLKGFFFWLKCPIGLRLLLFEVSKSHSDTHSRQDSSVRVISTSQRPLPTQHTTNTRDKPACPQRDSNPLSQQRSGCRRTPSTARPLGSAGKIQCFMFWPVCSEIKREDERF